MPRINRYEERLAEVLRRWLAALPAEGFTGTSAELWDAMDAARKPFELIPSPNALLRHLEDHAATVTVAGWQVRHRRTAHARLVVIEPTLNHFTTVPPGSSTASTTSL